MVACLVIREHLPQVEVDPVVIRLDALRIRGVDPVLPDWAPAEDRSLGETPLPFQDEAVEALLRRLTEHEWHQDVLVLTYERCFSRYSCRNSGSSL